jgi:hypothetical protein
VTAEGILKIADYVVKGWDVRGQFEARPEGGRWRLVLGHLSWSVSDHDDVAEAADALAAAWMLAQLRGEA